MTMFDAGIVEVMLLITAVDDKVWALQTELDGMSIDDEMYGYTEEEQARYMTLASSLREAYERAQASGEYPGLQAYSHFVRPGIPGHPIA